MTDLIFSHEELTSNLLICKTLLNQWIFQLEWNAVANGHYHQREFIEVKPMLHEFGDNVLEEIVGKAIFLTGNEVTPDDLHVCDRLKNKNRIILKFKDRKLKYSIQINRNVLQQKSLELSQLKFSGSFSLLRVYAMKTSSWLTNVTN